MKIQDLQAEINTIDQEIAQIESSAGQAIVKKLLNIIERLASSNDAQESELQKLRDEINRPTMANFFRTTLLSGLAAEPVGVI